MKAYNTPKDELHIESDTGETLVSITPEKTTIANLEGGAGGVILNLLESPDIGDYGGFYTEKPIDEILTIGDISSLKYVDGDEVYYFPVISVYNEGLDCIGIDLTTFTVPPTAVAINSFGKLLFDDDEYHYVFLITGGNQ